MRRLINALTVVIMNHMSVLDLRKLHQLHLIDLALFEIKKRAAALDPGRAIQSQIAALSETMEIKNAELHALTSEQKDLELRQKSIDEKVKKIDSDLYGGKVVNPREVETLQKEIANLKQQRSKLDERLFELMELIPPAQEALKEAQAPIEAKKKELGEYQKKVLVTKKELEDDYKKNVAARPAAEKAVDPSMLARYNAIKQRCGGIGMTDVKKGACAACGMNLPVKNIEAAREGRFATCEACHRILYVTDGLI